MLTHGAQVMILMPMEYFVYFRLNNLSHLSIIQ